MSQENLESGSEMPILAHLNELRVYVTRAFIGLIIGTILSFIFSRAIITFLTSCNFPPILIDPETVKASCPNIQTIRLTEGLEMYFRVAFISGAALAMPWMLLQLWYFIAPGLHVREKRSVYIFVPAASLLFFLGVAFAWYILMPPALVFLNQFLADTINIATTAESFIGFVTGFLFWLGVAFQMPLVFYFLARFGFVTAKLLRENWRYALVGIAIIAAIVTPSADPITMLLTMAPLIVLYLFSIVLARVGQRRFNPNPIEISDE